MPSVSVIICAYNGSHFLQRSLASVLAQTYEDWECLVVDDASTEDLSLVPGMTDPRVRHIRLDVNQGVGVTLNTGVVAARSPLVAFLAHDDDWLPTKLEKQMAAYAQANSPLFCYTDLEWVKPDGSRQVGEVGDLSYAGLLSHQFVSFCSLLMRRDVYLSVGGQSSALTWAQDYDFLLRLFHAPGDPVYVREPLTRYYLHETNRSKNYRGSVSHRRWVLELHRMRALRHQDSEILSAIAAGQRRANELYAAQGVDVARSEWKAGHLRGTLRHSAGALASSPRFASTLLTKGLRQPLRRVGSRQRRNEKGAA